MTSAYSSPDARRTYAVEAGGAATESMGGVVVVILAILALAGVASALLGRVSGIVFGGAFIVEGAAIAARRTALMSRIGEDAAAQLELGGGVTVELAGGLAAVILGILALVGVASPVLMPVLVITGGVAMVLAAGALQGLNHIKGAALGISPESQAVARAAVASAAGAQVLCGLGAGVLGILALIGVGTPMVLTTTGLLVLGAGLMLSGAALSGRMLRLFTHG